MSVVEVDGMSLTCGQIRAVADDPSGVSLTPAGMARVVASAIFAERTARIRPLYGRSTGVGANRSVLVGPDSQRHALMLLRSHATSAGPARSARRVRAMLVVRLNQLAAGGSGVAPGVAEALAEMIRLDGLPVIAERGSIGTGDLPALATTALALMGEGPTTVPLALLAQFGPSDGLAFISSNAAAIGDAALALEEIDLLLRAAIVVAALSFVAVHGNREAFSLPVELVTPFHGARVICQTMRHLTGETQSANVRIQDPFALRTIPQVLGPALDAQIGARTVVETLMNAPTENPLLLAGRPGVEGVVAHHGAFHLSYLQLAMDTLKLSVAQSGQSVLGRLNMLTDPAYTGLAPFLADGTPGASGVMMCEYVAASALGAMRAAAQPAGLQTVIVSRGVEDDASFASLAATQAMTSAGEYRTLLATELLCAVRAIRMQAADVPEGLAAAFHHCAALETNVADRNLTADLGSAERLLDSLSVFGSPS